MGFGDGWGDQDGRGLIPAAPARGSDPLTWRVTLRVLPRCRPELNRAHPGKCLSPGLRPPSTHAAANAPELIPALAGNFGVGIRPTPCFPTLCNQGQGAVVLWSIVTRARQRGEETSRAQFHCLLSCLCSPAVATLKTLADSTDLSIIF